VADVLDPSDIEGWQCGPECINLRLVDNIAEFRVHQ